MQHTHFSSTLILSLGIMISGWSTAFAQVGNSCGHPWQTPLKTVAGQIVKVYDRFMPGTALQGRHLQLKVAGEKMVIIHVIPKQCIDNNPDRFVFNLGESIMVRGSEFFSEQNGRQQNICAAEVFGSGYTFIGNNFLRNTATGILNRNLCRPNCGPICTKQCAGMKMRETCLQACNHVCTNVMQ